MPYSKLTLLMALSLSLAACGGGSSSSDPDPEPPQVVDSDNDGVADTQDAFPNDPNESKDSDGDGVGDNADVFPNDASENADSDSDGVGDNADVFPNDASESTDSDSDGVGDNADAFPNDGNETLDSDGDGVGDNADVFPNDGTEVADSDGDGVGDNADAFPSDPDRSVTLCTPQGNEVNFAALLSENCATLSSYNLFADATNPTANVNGTKSLKYELSVPLFTDYATKYRFVVMPEDKSADYSESEVLEMPVGTVLIKTFSLPADTSARGFDNESLIETRLLIHREDGWKALPYRWDENGQEATFVASGRTFERSLTHKGMEMTFDYSIPSTTDCKECHQLLDTNEDGSAIAGSGKFAPIGPKVRLMNYAIDFDGESTNQLAKWIEQEMLQGAPSDLTQLTSIPELLDEEIDDVTGGVLSVDTINQLARGYLDINCAHCHRPIGSANNYGLFLEYNRPLSVETGVCKSPIAPPGNSSIEGDLLAIIPGEADRSFLYERISSTDGGLKMPKIGRSLVHGEGTELIKYWINILDEDPFNQNCN